jgi:hypothetical protein
VKTAHIMDAVPEDIPYHYGKTYLTFVFAPIPRTMWPDKPSIGLGPMIGELVYNRQRSGVPPGMMGEAYINFGMIGIFSSLFILGYVLKTIFISLEPFLNHRNGILIYIAFLRIPIVTIGMDVTVSIVQFLLEMIPILLALQYISIKARPSHDLGRAPLPSGAVRKSQPA